MWGLGNGLQVERTSSHPSTAASQTGKRPDSLRAHREAGTRGQEGLKETGATQ